MDSVRVKIALVSSLDRLSSFIVPNVRGLVSAMVSL